MIKIRFTASGNRRYYGTTNGVSWYPLSAEHASELTQSGIPLELT